MTRRLVFFIVVFSLACGPSGTEEPFSPPSSLPGAGALVEGNPVPAAEVPADIAGRGLQHATRARYSGDAEVTVTFYRMSDGSTAFELMQTWRPAEGRLAVYTGPWFAVIESEGLDTAALSEIAAAVETALADR